MGSRMKNVISKRRPRQNIISIILNIAKNKGSASGGAATPPASSTPRSSGDSDPNKNVKKSSSSKRKGILQSAVDLTRRIGRRTHPTLGQKAFYRSAKGVAKVTIVGIHHDAKSEPYYTIKLRDGKEKQTDGQHLTPIQEEATGSSNSNSGGNGNGGSGSGGGRSSSSASKSKQRSSQSSQRTQRQR